MNVRRATGTIVRQRSALGFNAAMSMALLCATSPVLAATIVGTPANESLVGTAAGDRMSGDSLLTNALDFAIGCRAGAGIENQTVNGANVQGADLGRDDLADLAGDDEIVGDVRIDGSFAEFQIYVLAGTGAIFGGAGGNFNGAHCHSDSNSFQLGATRYKGGAGLDTFVGDASYANTTSSDFNLDAGAGSAGMGRFSFYPYGPGGAGGDIKNALAFGDFIDFSASLLGAKTIVGDAMTSTGPGNDDTLVASAGSGSMAPGGGGGNTNTLIAFGDNGVGAVAADRIIGDVFRIAGPGDVRLIVSAGSGELGTPGGANNFVRAFLDTLIGNGGADFLVGDALVQGTGGADLHFVIHSGDKTPANAASGSGNQSVAFNDNLAGGAGADMLIGEGENASDHDAVRFVIKGENVNTIRAFEDVIDGGGGADVIHGDLRYAGEACKITDVTDAFAVEGAFAGRSQLFGDDIHAGDSADIIHGGFGADTMRGDSGRDTFVYYAADLVPIASSLPPVDTIVRFDPQKFAGDVLDLRPLLSCLGFDHGDDPNQWLQLSGGQLKIDLDGPAGGFTPVPFINLPGVRGSVDSLLAGGFFGRNLYVP
jgi:hypothetical protein